MHSFLAEIAAIAVFFLGFYGLITSKNIIKSIVSIGLMEIAVVVFFLSLGFVDGIRPPIGLEMAGNVADPLPQALMLTAIIIGLTVTAINLTMLISLYRECKTTDWEIAKKLRNRIRSK
ncbi:MAG: cation:proton antiporter subunit C [Clostridia bacterium]|nr:cation:proton antiporter subunit C [Clostridia bacterium]